MPLCLLAGRWAQEEQFSVEEATISQIHAAMQSGEITSSALVGMYLDRIEAYDKQGPRLNSVIFLNPDALSRAEELDRRFEQSGLTGPLHGIPILLKDNVNTADMPTTGGSLSLEGVVPKDDAFITKKLRDAGAIILAKVNLHEFATRGETRSSVLGQTLNPYDLTRTPGGSSGGTAAAVAANFGLAGIGTDTVNSIRSPASANSLVGIRPTLGLVSRSGIIPVSSTQDTAGPIARTVADAAKVLEAIAGHDADDEATAGSTGRSGGYAGAPDAEGLLGARLGVLRSFLGREEVHREVNRVVERALVRLRDQGATVVMIDEVFDADQLIADISVHAHEYRQLLNDYLATLGDDAPASLEKIMSSGHHDPSIAGFFQSAIDNASARDDYEERLRRREELQARLSRLFADNRLDALVYPLQKRLVVPIGEDQVERNGILGAASGFPAITVPGGFSAATDTAPIGVPVGIEFLGRPWSEAELIRIAYAFEQATRFRRPPTSTPPL